MQRRGRAEAHATEVIPKAKKALSRLVDWANLEEWRQDNPYIYGSYVRTQASIVSVVKSLFFVHNETGNIYTHLVPALAVAIFSLVAFTKLLPIDHSIATAQDYATFQIFSVSFIGCLGLSAVFHLCKSHSERIFVLGNMLDYLGICVLIAGSTISIILFGFDDLKYWRNLFIGLTSVFGAICGYISLNPKFKEPHKRGFRATMFVLYGLSGVAPVLVGIWLMGYEELSKRLGLFWMIMEGVWYISGAAFYGALIPERIFPGKFDNFGHSHQIFHVFVVIAAYCHFRALLQAYGEYVIRRAIY